jgi:exosortase/archaeosortase
MFDFKPFMEFFTEIATKFGAKMAFALVSSFLLFAYPVMAEPTETIALAKIAAVAIIGVVFLVFRFKQDQLKNGGSQ